MSKVFERILLHRLDETIHIAGLLPINQFGFRNNQSTIQQCHIVVKKKNQRKHRRKENVHLSYKLKLRLPDHLYLLLKSYLCKRYFQVKIGDELSDYHPIRAEIPQGSVLGPLLYLIYIADVPATQDMLMATFAEDTAILSSDPDPVRTTEKL